MRSILKIALLLMVTIPVSCKRFANPFAGGDKVLAEVGGEKLYVHDLSSIFTPDMAPEDSVKILGSYVDRWVKMQLKIQEAERMFESSQQDIDRMVEEYRNSLLTHKVDQYYVDKLIDTLFTDSQIGEYYRKNQADFVLDKAYFTELRAAVDKVDSPFLRGYAAILIDSANLRSAVRTLRMGKGQDFLREVLIPDGNVGAERVANATDKDSLAALYAHSALEKAAVLGGEALAGGSMTAFELACDNAVNDYLKGARLISYGCEVPVAYMAAVEGEITAIRMILTGRLAGVPSQTIRERLRDLYV